MKNPNRGFTLVELVTVFAVIAFLVIVVWGLAINTVCKGNFWFQNETALTELQVSHPEAKKILTAQRNIVADSALLVENSDGSRSEYCLDTDLLFNYEFHDCKK